MCIWIRSQNNKMLVWAGEIGIREILFGYEIWADGEEVAEYPTEDEAIEALDMIQNYINDIAYVQHTESNVIFIPPVFRMPPAGFSEEE